MARCCGIEFHRGYVKTIKSLTHSTECAAVRTLTSSTLDLVGLAEFNAPLRRALNAVLADLANVHAVAHAHCERL